eukprot:gb/GEZN01003632.1/.p1 GENE.gb/GEZN01003632.1/~~gb/GEZN01003632.1/.p1  ORF type:complete len:498 (+),score=76.79 gb/GEZN01003632.1/:59-1495(+)
MRVASLKGKLAGRVVSRPHLSVSSSAGVPHQSVHTTTKFGHTLSSASSGVSCPSSSSSSSSSSWRQVRAAVGVAVAGATGSLLLEESDLSLSSAATRFLPLSSLHADPQPSPSPCPASSPSSDSSNSSGGKVPEVSEGMGTTFTRPSDTGGFSGAPLSGDAPEGKRLKRVRKKVARKKAPAADLCKPPGKFDEFDHPAKLCFMDFAHPIFGAQLTIQTSPLNDPSTMDARKQEKQVELSTTVDIGGPEPTSFSATVILGEKQSHILVGKLDTEYGINGRYIGKDVAGVSGSELELHFGISDRPEKAMYNSFVLVTGYKGSDYNLSGVVHNGSSYNMSYAQSVTPSLAVGVDLVHNLGVQTMLAGGVRYKNVGDDKLGYVITSLLSGRECSLSYTRHASPTLSLASEIKWVPSQEVIQGRAGLNFKHRSFQFTGMLDDQGTMAATLEYDLAPMLRLTMSGIMQHQQWRSMWGIGLMMAI